MSGPLPKNQPFPAPQTDGAPALQRWQAKVRDWANQFTVDLDPPGPIPVSTAVASELRVTITWSPAKKAYYYWLYRGTTGDFAQANLFHQTVASKTQVATYRYLDTQITEAGTLYYWIVPLNERLVAGPRSQMMTVNAFSTVGVTTTLPDGATTQIFRLNFGGIFADVPGKRGAGLLSYSVSTYDGTDLQIATGIQAFEAGYAAGPTFIGTIGPIGSELQRVSSGTLSVTWGIASTSPSAPGFRVEVLPSSSLGTDSTIIYSITNLSEYDIQLL